MTERPVISARPSTKEWIKVIECYQETLGFASELKKLLFFFRQQISLIKFLFDLPLLVEHHNIRPFGVNALNGESIIRYPFHFGKTEWKKGQETRDGYFIASFDFLKKKAFDLCIRSPNLVQFHPSSLLSESSWKKKKRFTSHYICGSHQSIKPGGCSLFDQ